MEVQLFTSDIPHTKLEPPAGQPLARTIKCCTGPSRPLIQWCCEPHIWMWEDKCEGEDGCRDQGRQGIKGCLECTIVTHKIGDPSGQECGRSLGGKGLQSGRLHLGLAVYSPSEPHWWPVELYPVMGLSGQWAWSWEQGREEVLVVKDKLFEKCSPGWGCSSMVEHCLVCMRP
jgi:hypothetical protein